MFCRTRGRLLLVHSPRGVNFSLSSDEAVQRVREKYGKRWFGARVDFLELKTPSKEFLPFYLCSGRVRGTFTAVTTYNTTASTTSTGKDSPPSSTTTVNSGPHQLDSIFEENRTQIYAGYKYNIANVHYALKSEALPMNMKKMSLVDTTEATLNLFEQSTGTMKEFVEQEVRTQAVRTAESIVREFHPTASTVSIGFQDLHIKIEEVTPCFVPCYVIKVSYEANEYTLYVSGMDGTVGGPYLLNAVYFARSASALAALTTLLFTPNKVAGLLFGSFLALLVYYPVFYAAKRFPTWRRDWFRQKRAAMKSQHNTTDRNGFRPSKDSARIQQEYQQSTYWDRHAYEKRRGSSSSSSSSSSSGRASAESSTGRSASSGPAARDAKGYYKRLGLAGDESVNEIRSAYRKIVLKQHPDVGGSTESMAMVNEAYRVLRDPKRRAEYDRL